MDKILHHRGWCTISHYYRVSYIPGGAGFQPSTGITTTKYKRKMQLATRCFSVVSPYMQLRCPVHEIAWVRLWGWRMGMGGKKAHKEAPYEPQKRWHFKLVPTWSLTYIAPEKWLSQKENSLPTIHFQGRTVKLRGCTFCETSSNVLSWMCNSSMLGTCSKKDILPNGGNGSIPKKTHTQKQKSKNNWRLIPVLKAPQKPGRFQRIIETNYCFWCKLAVGVVKANHHRFKVW